MKRKFPVRPSDLPARPYRKKKGSNLPNSAGYMTPAGPRKNRGYPQPKRVWVRHCKFCRGEGKVRVGPGWMDCQGCNGSGYV